MRWEIGSLDGTRRMRVRAKWETDSLLASGRDGKWRSMRVERERERSGAVVDMYLVLVMYTRDLVYSVVWI
jgi:hypothetical protein